MGRGILPDGDDTEELSMKAPMSGALNIGASETTHIININQAGVGFYLHREGPNLGKNIVSLVSCYHPPRRTVRDPLPEIRRF